MEETNTKNHDPEECKLDKLGFPITDYCAKFNISEAEF